MQRLAARRFQAWIIDYDSGDLIALCRVCGESIRVSLGPVDLSPWLDQLLDHDWLHDPEASAPDDVVNAVLDAKP